MKFFSLEIVTAWKRTRIYTMFALKKKKKVDLNDKERSPLGCGLKYYL